MKVEQEAQQFNSVTITLETEEEVAKFFAILSFHPLNRALDTHDWYKTFSSRIEVVPVYKEWFNRIKRVMDRYKE